MGIADLVRDRVEWTDDVRSFDFGCGFHGSVATQLCDLAKSTVAVDANPEVIADFNRRCTDQGSAREEVCGLLAADFFGNPEHDQFFDVGVASLVWHHIDADERPETAQKLARKSKRSGTLFVVDLDARSDPTINGVDPRALQSVLSQAGFNHISIRNGPKITLASGKKSRLLICTARF